MAMTKHSYAHAQQDVNELISAIRNWFVKLHGRFTDEHVILPKLKIWFR